MNVQMTTTRLSTDALHKLLILAKLKGKTKSDIIKESLDMYYEREESEIDSFTLGENFFGKYSSGESDRAATYKERLKKKLSGKVRGA